MTEINHRPRTAKERGRTAPAKFAHVVLRSAQADKVVAWYKTVLEAEVTFGDQGICFLTYDEEHHRSILPKWPPNSRRRQTTARPPVPERQNGPLAGGRPLLGGFIPAGKDSLPTPNAEP